MSEWKEDDSVVTTYRTLEMATAEAFEAGAKQERERIIKMFETTSFVEGLSLSETCSATGALLRVYVAIQKGAHNE